MMFLIWAHKTALAKLRTTMVHLVLSFCHFISPGISFTDGFRSTCRYVWLEFVFGYVKIFSGWFLLSLTLLAINYPSSIKTQVFSSYVMPGVACQISWNLSSITYFYLCSRMIAWFVSQPCFVYFSRACWRWTNDDSSVLPVCLSMEMLWMHGCSLV